MVRAVPLPLSLLQLAVAAPDLYAQSPPDAPSQQQASAVDSGSIEALKKMRADLQRPTRFQVSTDLTAAQVWADGKELQHAATAAFDVARPSKLRALMRSARSERELFYDGKTVYGCGARI
jgi:hypothetical protein